ncbi:MAG: winged helix-turn-helix transcriptional regulator [Polaromonas sp.]|nr:winged helix-turn-helix transcriptional regulator [Polaromonas sp.]
MPSQTFPKSDSKASGCSFSGAPSDFYHADGYKPDDSVGYLMRRIISLVGQGIEREMEPSGLTNAQWMPLLKLYMGLASTVAELARECDLDAGSMTRLLDRLEAKQLCRRVRSSDDRRVVNIELTESGRAAAKEIPQTLCRVQNAHLAGFSVEEWQVLKSFLRRILDTAQTLNAAADKPLQSASQGVNHTTRTAANPSSVEK